MTNNNLTFTFDDILDFFVHNNGSVIYTNIVTHFKSALSDPQTRDIARTVFKDHVNTLATVSTINGTKYLLLRDKFKKHLSSNESLQNKKEIIYKHPNETQTFPKLQQLPNHQNHQISNHQMHSLQSHHYQQQQQQQPSSASPPQQPPQQNQQQQQQIQNNSKQQTQNIQNSLINSANHQISRAIKINDHQNQPSINERRESIPDEELMPPPPPRPLRQKSNNSEQKSIQQSSSSSSSSSSSPQKPTETTNKENVIPESPNENEVKKEIQELAMTAGRVKEHAQILNKLTSNGDFKLPMPSAVTSVVNKIRSGQPPGNDNDSGQLSVTEKHKKWIVAAATCDYNEMVAMLKDDQNLASYCDFIHGFNALHWAAKFGRPDIVKLIAGKYQVDPNLKSFSGSTPLHFAAIFGHTVIWELLVEVYLANKDIRDHDGKKPSAYLKKPESSNTENSKETEESSGTPSPKEDNTEIREPKMNLRNKITYQSMLVRNKFRKSKSFQRRKSVAKS